LDSHLFDLATYRVRRLDPKQGGKPLDFGYGGVTGSINADGRLIAVNGYHPTHGYMTVTSQPPFADEDRYDPQKVRTYRRSLATNVGFGLRFKLPIVERSAYLVEGAIPLLCFKLENGVIAECLTLAIVTTSVGVKHMWRFSEPADWATWEGDVWLKRSAYTQLTEGGVMIFPSPETTVTQVDDILRLHNRVLPATALLSPLISFDGSVAIPGDVTGFDVHIGLGVADEDVQPSLESARETGVAETLDYWQGRATASLSASNPDSTLDAVIERAWVYGRQCCVPIGGEAVCILTDHMLLPLSWNRDAYYVAALLLQSDATDHALVRGHLIWMFERAERKDGYWGRAYVANGVLKDKGYQLDQQIFPLLELAEYVEQTGDGALLERLRPIAEATLDAILTRRDAVTGLFPTEETPADDPLEDHPFHFSSHVLLWHTLRQLASLLAQPELLAMADDLRDRIEAAFVTNGIYAYAVNADSDARLYHDANDIPLVMMPIWGYCDANNATWLATLDFAWSNANEGFYQGELGSVHTPAPWPLGLAQALIVARIRGDVDYQSAVIDEIRRAAQWDGALPEAYKGDDHQVESRHWFAWPNVMVALAANTY
jgi:hypothetical protein